MPAKEKAYVGSCLCGRVRYSAEGPLSELGHCHCTDCRKGHGAAFGSYVAVLPDRFTVVQGQNDLQSYEAESGTRHSFCRTCGSSLTAESYKWDAIYVAAGTLDTPLELKPAYHIYVRSKVPWYEIRDGVPQHATDPEGGES